MTKDITLFGDIPKENGTYFKSQKRLKTPEVLEKLKERTQMRFRRQELIAETRDKRKEIYNLTMKIEHIDRLVDVSLR